MSVEDKDNLHGLLAEWNQLPALMPGTVECVLGACRARSPRIMSIGLRLALASLGFGAATGAVYGELVSLRHDALLNSKMSSLYLHSIDPDLGGPSAK